MENDSFYNLILRNFTNEITVEEKNRLDKWLAESPNNLELYDQISALLSKMKSPQKLNFPDLDAEWERLKNKLQLKGAPSDSGTKTFSAFVSQPTIPRSSNVFLWKYAAAASVLLAFLFLYYWFSAVPQEKLSELVTKNGEIRELSLSDGSQVNLNNASRLEYPAEFSDKEREVYLEGEAFFQIAQDNRPFIVKTRRALVSVLGTEFNLRERSDVTKVTVREGSVSFSAFNNDGNKLILNPNQMAVLENGILSGPFDITNIDNLPGWLNNRIVFDKTSLKEVSEELNRIYDIEVKLEDESLNELSVSGSFEKKPLEIILEALCLTLELNYRAGPDAYVIYR